MHFVSFLSNSYGFLLVIIVAFINNYVAIQKSCFLCLLNEFSFFFCFISLVT